MPTIATRTPVLEGKGEVINYERNLEAFYLRVYVKAKRGYKTERIPECTSVEEAVEHALDVFLDLNSREDRPLRRRTLNGDNTSTTSDQRSRGISILSAIEKYLEYEQERVEAGLINQLTHTSKSETLRIHFTSYCQGKGITKTSQIIKGKLDDYLTTRGKVCAKLTLKKELINITAFIRYLVRQGLVSAVEIADNSMFPTVRIKQDELDGNPPIRDEDMRRIWTEVHRWVKEADAHPSPRVKYWRNKFWCFLAILRTTGMRPGEVRLLKWKDVEIENRPRTKSNGDKEDVFVAHILIRKTKTGRPREVSSRAADRIMAFHEVVKIYTKTAKNVRGELRPDSYIFGDPHQDDFKLTGYNSFLKSWHKIMKRLDGELKGARMSDKAYTLYSFRSSRVNELLTEGVDIFIISKQLGHSVEVLQKYYERLADVRDRATAEAAAISYGKTKDVKEVVDLFKTR